MNEHSQDLPSTYLEATSKPHFIPFACLPLNMATCRNVMHGRISNAYPLLCNLTAVSDEMCSKVL